MNFVLVLRKNNWNSSDSESGDDDDIVSHSEESVYSADRQEERPINSRRPTTATAAAVSRKTKPAPNRRPAKRPKKTKSKYYSDESGSDYSEDGHKR